MRPSRSLRDSLLMLRGMRAGGDTLRSLATRSWGRPVSRIVSTPRQRMAQDADFRGRAEPASLKREPAQKIDAIDELMRIVAAAGPDLAHRANERKFADRLRRPQGRRQTPAGTFQFVAPCARTGSTARQPESTLC